MLVAPGSAAIFGGTGALSSNAQGPNAPPLCWWQRRVGRRNRVLLLPFASSASVMASPSVVRRKRAQPSPADPDPSSPLGCRLDRTIRFRPRVGALSTAIRRSPKRPDSSRTAGATIDQRPSRVRRAANKGSSAFVERGGPHPQQIDRLSDCITTKSVKRGASMRPLSYFSVAPAKEKPPPQRGSHFGLPHWISAQTRS
jgi:hypothetical protein